MKFNAGARGLGRFYRGGHLLRWRDAVVEPTVVPHGQSAIGPSLLPYSINGGDASFPQAMGLTLPDREH